MRNTYDKPMEGKLRNKTIIGWCIVESPLGMDGGKQAKRAL
jgi:hypothetical protein